ncbi:MAG: hypothetical protein AAB930_01175 [Patescibacteria group bacterium]
MKTIFIASFHPYIARNILATRAFGLLAEQSDLRFVIFCLGYKKEYFEKRFGRENVIIEGVNFDFPSKRLSSFAMKRIAKYGLYSTSTLLERERKKAMDGRLLYYLATALLAIALSRLGFVSRLKRRIMRIADYQLSDKDRYRIYFEKYRPDLVWVTDIQSERDVELLHNAKFFGVKTIANVRAWDNLTLHGLIRVLPDLLFAQAEKIKEQAIKYDDMPSEKIRVVGVAHYDRYMAEPHQSKNGFLTSLGFSGIQLSDEKPLILWTPIGDNYLDSNDTDLYTCKVLGSIRANVVARFSPTIPVKQMEDVRPSDNMVFDRPGVNFRPGIIGDQEISEGDDERLIEEIYFSNVVVCGPTTVALDAVFMDKPVILIGFHPRQLSYLGGILRRYDYDHFKFAIECGAFTVAKSREELLKYIDEYARNPQAKSREREILRNAYCGPADGKSGERIAKVVLSMLK